MKKQKRLFQGIEDCAACHIQYFKEWNNAPHSQAIVSSKAAYKNYVKDLKANGLKPGRTEMAACDTCHAPTMQKYVSDKVYEKVADIIGGDDDEKFNTLKPIGVGCIVCHSMHPTGELGDKFYGTIKSPKGAPHGTIHMPDMSKGEFCQKCHQTLDTKVLEPIKAKGMRFGKTETIWCTTSYDDWKISGSKTTCQECHMEPYEGEAAIGGPKRTLHRHHFPGSQNKEMLEKATDITISTMDMKNGTVVANVEIFNKAHKIIPSGCLILADIILKINVRDDSDKVIYSREKSIYAGSPGIMPAFAAEKWKEVPRTAAIWLLDDYDRTTALQVGKNLVTVQFKVPSNTKGVTVDAELVHKQKGKTTVMKKQSASISLK